jgi:hypothetical protein
MTMSEAVLILPNMRGGCATVGTTVHTLFRVTSRRPRPMAEPRASTPEPISLHCSEQAERTSGS